LPWEPKHTADDDLLGRDALFGDDLPVKTGKGPEKSGGSGIKGFLQFEAARTTADPEHWSKLRARTEIGSFRAPGRWPQMETGRAGRLRLRLRINDFYNSRLRSTATSGETSSFAKTTSITALATGISDSADSMSSGAKWSDFSSPTWSQLVTCVNFCCPISIRLRIPQWAARAEYFSDDYHAELLWIPVASYDNIGKPGAEFYPTNPSHRVLISAYQQELRPERNADSMNYGLRLSTLKNGWDVSAFYYRSTDINQTFYREIIIAPTPTLVYQARHDRISQVGSTLAKDFGDVVLKGEAVYTRGRSFTTLDATDSDGVTSTKHN
jgi:hypothetical protein